MAGWTKAQYDAAYRCQIERRMPGGGPPPAEGRPPVYIRYHKWYMKPILESMWAKLQPVLNISAIEDVCVVGAGFGWGVEALATESGANVIGIDISDYIVANYSVSEEAELRAEVTLAGLDPDTGRGLEVMSFIYDGQPRTGVIVYQEDMSSSESKAAIRTALGGVWPSVIVYENIVDDSWTDQDIINARNAGNGFGGSQRMIWVYKGTPARTLQNLFDLLPAGSEVISTDGSVYLA